MKLCDILKVIKKGSVRYLLNGKNEQWVSDEYAAYVLEQMPKLDAESFSVVASERFDDVLYRERDLPTGTNFEDNDIAENPIEKAPVEFDDKIPFYTQNGVTCVESKYFAAFKDEKEEELRYYERINPKGEIYIAVKRGLTLIALIYPTIYSEERAEDFEKFAIEMKMGVYKQTRGVINCDVEEDEDDD